jgi:hypothetical protein
MRAGFTIQGNYTWSKFLEGTTFLNAFDTIPERVISDQDRQHRFVVNGIWELPFGPGKRLGPHVKGLAQIFGGWQLQAIYQAQSGAPLAWGNILFTGDLHAIPLSPDQRTVDHWFNTDAGFEKNSGRQLDYNVRAFPSRLTGVRGQGVNLWNFSALKSFRIRERVKLEFRAELLNAFGRTFFGAPNTGPTSTLFGTISTTNGYSRVMWLVGKLQF